MFSNHMNGVYLYFYIKAKPVIG